MKKTIFPQNFVYVLRTITTHHMVSFMDFYFHFLTHFQSLYSPHMFSTFTHVMLRDTHSELGLPVVWSDREVKSSHVFVYIHLAFVRRTISPASKSKKNYIETTPSTNNWDEGGHGFDSGWVFVPPLCHVHQFDLVSCWYVDLFSHLIGSFLWYLGGQMHKLRHGQEQLLMKDTLWLAQKLLQDDSVAAANFLQLKM